MPSPQRETRTLPELVQVLLDVGLVARAEELAGAELLVGWESAVVRSRNGWIYRFGRMGEVSFRRELQVLELVDGRLGVQTPQVEAVDQPQLLMAYRTLVGAQFDERAALGRSAADRQPLVRSLADVLASVHGLRTEAEASIAVPTLDPTPMLEEVRAARSSLQRADRAVLDEVLAAWELRVKAGRADRPVLLHGDFHFGNMVLADPTGPVTGIWDFSCVEVGDPTADLRYLAGDAMVLAEEVSTAYAAVTGRPIDVHGARLMSVLEEVSDAIAEDRSIGDAVRGWLPPDRR